MDRLKLTPLVLNLAQHRTLRLILRGIKFSIQEISYRLLNGFAPPLLHVEIGLTYRCNLKCKMCSLPQQNRDYYGTYQELTSAEVKNIVRQIASKFPLAFVAFSGGEALLRKDTLEILRYATTELHAIVTLLTNGVLLTEETCRELVDMGLPFIRISIDGPEEIHNEIRGIPGVYQKTIEGINRLNKYKKEFGKKTPRIIVNPVVLPSNVAYLHQIIDICANLGVEQCQFGIDDPNFSARSGLNLQSEWTDYFSTNEIDKIDSKILASAIEKVKAKSEEKHIPFVFIPDIQAQGVINYYQDNMPLDKWTCREPWLLMRISPYGEVFPCVNYRIGNIREQKLSKLWNNERYRRFRNELRRNGLPLVCTGCCWLQKRSWLGFPSRH